MIIKEHKNHIFFLLLFVMLFSGLFAQSVDVITDRNQILIGERVVYELRVKLPSQGYTVNFHIPELIPHFEIIDKKGTDTVNNSGSLISSRKFVFTSFDSGSWYIPAFPVTLVYNGSSTKLLSDSMLINVGYSPADTTGNLRDIKPIMEVQVENYFWYYLAAALLLLAILVILYLKYFRKKKIEPLTVFNSSISPYQEAMRDLKELSEYTIDTPAAIKHYHSQLGLIFKRYYSRIIAQDLLNSTTGDLLLKLKEQQVEASIISAIAEPLRIADAAKFAKYLPGIPESRNSLRDVKNVVEELDRKKSSNKQPL